MANKNTAPPLPLPTKLATHLIHEHASSSFWKYDYHNVAQFHEYITMDLRSWEQPMCATATCQACKSVCVTHRLFVVGIDFAQAISKSTASSVDAARSCRTSNGVAVRGGFWYIFGPATTCFQITDQMTKRYSWYNVTGFVFYELCPGGFLLCDACAHRIDAFLPKERARLSMEETIRSAIFDIVIPDLHAIILSYLGAEFAAYCAQ